MSQVVSIATSYREASARRIRELLQSWTENTLELGAELRTARDSFAVGPRQSRPGWEEWLQKEIGLSENWAGQLIRVADKFGDLLAGGQKLPSMKVLSFLTHENIPETGRVEVIDKVARGERVGLTRAKEIVDQHRPTPKEADRIAKETGKPTHASDGNIYFGSDKDKVKQAEQVRTMVFDVRRAVETLATMDVTPADFIKQCPAHLRWKDKEEHMIGDALDWLRGLNKAWDSRG